MSFDRSDESADLLRDALQQQEDGEAHDRGLIWERLSWTPEERLAANAAFLRFYLAVRPEGPLKGSCGHVNVSLDPSFDHQVVLTVNFPDYL